MGRSSRMILPLVLLGLLGALATLRYRWVGQLGAAERERLQDSLRMRGAHFTQDFDRELTRAFFWLHFDSPQAGEPGEAVERYRRWFAAAPHAGLLAALYRIDRDATGLTRIRRFDPDVNDLVETTWTWPDALEPWRTRIEAAPSSPGTAPDGPVFPRMGPLAEEVPALIIPAASLRVAQDGDVQRLRVDVSTGFTIAILDRTYMRDVLLPALAVQHFGEAESAEYRLAVVRRETGDIVYATPGWDPGADSAQADASRHFFSIRFEEFGRFVVGDRQQSPAGEVDPGPGDRVAISITRREPGSRAPGSGFGRSDGPWELRLTHRAGSLDAAVSQVRRRNLIVSFGVLTLLTASIALVLLSSIRARRLASQQLEFVAGVSHELRTPLAVIRSAGENLADGVVANAGQVQRYGQLIASEGRRLSEMVEQVMEFAGMQSGRPVLDRRPSDPAEIVAGAVAASRPLLEEAGIEVECRVETAQVQILADPAALGRSVENLLANAAKHAAAGRWIGITLRLDARAGKAGEVVIDVRDRGPGIAVSDLPHVFEPFYRGAPARAAQVHGAGLGLSLVRRIVEAHGGRIVASSLAGEGSVFSIHLPVLASGLHGELADAGEGRGGQAGPRGSLAAARPAGHR